MEQIENLSQDDVLDLIKDFPLQPLGRRAIITINTVDNLSDLSLSESDLSEVQYVVAIGKSVMEFKPGQKILLDLNKMVKMIPVDENSGEMKPVIEIDPVEVDGRKYAIITASNVLCNDNR